MKRICGRVEDDMVDIAIESRICLGSLDVDDVDDVRVASFADLLVLKDSSLSFEVASPRRFDSCVQPELASMKSRLSSKEGKQGMWLVDFLYK